MLSVEDTVASYRDSMSSTAAKQKYVKKIQAVTESPMAKAADADALFLERVTKSVTSGRRAAKLRATPLARWKDNAIAKVDRLSTGAIQSLDKVRAHFQEWGPAYAEAKAAAASIPAGDLDQSMRKVRAAVEVLMRKAGKM